MASLAKAATLSGRLTGGVPFEPPFEPVGAGGRTAKRPFGRVAAPGEPHRANGLRKGGVAPRKLRQ